MSFANQALAVTWLATTKEKLEPKVYGIPASQDQSIAGLKLEAMGIGIDKLTKEQAEYLAGWREGT